MDKKTFLQFLKRSLIYICFLNILDMILTYIGISSGYAIEINPFMLSFISDLPTLIVLKVLIPICLSLYLYIRQKNSSLENFKQKRIAIRICLIFYVLVNLNHLIWIFFIFI